MILTSIEDYKIGGIYQLIKPIAQHDLNEYGLEVGDYISVMATEQSYDRYSKSFSIWATKIVQLKNEYCPTLDTVLSKWSKEYFLQVDMNYLSDDMHNDYVQAMHNTPRYMMNCV